MSADVTLIQRALITTQEMYDYLQDSRYDNEDIVNLGINFVSEFVPRYTQREIKPCKIRNERQSTRERILSLEEYPIIRVSSIKVGTPVMETVTGTVDSGSTTTLVDAARTEADDYWNGARLEVEVDTDDWRSVYINDFVASTDTLSWLAKDTLDAAPATGDAYKLWLPSKATLTELTDKEYVSLDQCGMEAGQITLAQDYSDLWIDYFAGYSVIPSDLLATIKDVVKELINPLMGQGLASINAGSVQATFGSGIEKVLANEKYMAVLNSYKKIHF